LRTKTALSTLLLVAGFAVAGTQMGLAESTDSSNDPAESQALMKSKVTLVQAVQAAEAKAGGRSTSVDIKLGGGTSVPFYQVEIIATDGSRRDLAIDASTGEVMKLANADEYHDAGEGDENGSSENGENGSDESGQN
jgi:uncharacterized membrane protein YkoI